MPGGTQQILSIIKKEDILNIHCLFEEFGHQSLETLVNCELCAIDKNKTSMQHTARARLSKRIRFFSESSANQIKIV